MSKYIPTLQRYSKQFLTYATPKFKVFMKYAKVELAPPTTPTEIKEIGTGIAKLASAVKRGRWKEVTVREAWLNTLVTVEVLCWFYVGECIGKRHIVGYNV